MSRAKQSGYLIPLHDVGMPPRSYLFAFGVSADEDATMQELQGLVEGFGAPWHARSEVTPVTLNRDSIAQLPSNLLLKDELATADWSAPALDLPAAELVLCGSSSCLVLREDVPQLRADEEARRRAGQAPESWFPAGEDAMWRTGRALILVDLDETHRGIAAAAAKYALGDFRRAVAWGEHERAIQEGQAQEWNREAGTFRSPTETRRRFEAQRREALDRLARRYYPAPVYPSRLPYVKPEVVQRAEQRGTSAFEEWKTARRTGLELVLPAVMDRWFEGLSKQLRLSRHPLRTLKLRFAASFAELVKAVRQPLNNSVTEDFCPGPRQQYECRREYSESELRRDFASYPGACDEEAFLTQLGEQERMRVLDDVVSALSPRERELLAAIRSGVRPTEWGRENGVADGTVHAMCSRIREKARKVAMELKLGVS